MEKKPGSQLFDPAETALPDIEVKQGIFSQHQKSQ
jgi:hypothetical protein